MRWADLPERYGKYEGVHKRFMRWAEAGVWDRLFDDLVTDRKNPYLVLDSTTRLSSTSGNGPQKGGEDKSLGRSRGGLSTKIHLLANSLGEPVAFRWTGGQAEIVMADRGYDSNAIVAAIESIGAEAVIPSKICRKVQRPHDRTLYKLRNRIERCFKPTQAFPQTRYPILQTKSSLPSHRRTRLYLATFRAICRYSLGRAK